MLLPFSIRQIVIIGFIVLKNAKRDHIIDTLEVINVDIWGFGFVVTLSVNSGSYFF